MVTQSRKLSVSVGRGGAVLHVVACTNQPVLILVASVILAVRLLVANAGASERDTTVPTPKQLSSVKNNPSLDIFRSNCKVLRLPKAIVRISARQRLMHWFRAAMTAWMSERAKRHLSRNTEAYQSFQRDIGPGASKKAFQAQRNAVTAAVKQVLESPCITEHDKNRFYKLT